VVFFWQFKVFIAFRAFFGPWKPWPFFFLLAFVLHIFGSTSWNHVLQSHINPQIARNIFWVDHSVGANSKEGLSEGHWTDENASKGLRLRIQRNEQLKQNEQLKIIRYYSKAMFFFSLILRCTKQIFHWPFCPSTTEVTPTIWNWR